MCNDQLPAFRPFNQGIKVADGLFRAGRMLYHAQAKDHIKTFIGKRHIIDIGLDNKVLAGLRKIFGIHFYRRTEIG